MKVARPGRLELPTLSWKFAIVEQDSSGVPKFIGWANTKEEAEQLRMSAETVGWRKVAVHDAESLPLGLKHPV